jgi:hypothetical protein
MKILKERYKNIGMLKFGFHIEYTVRTLQQLYKSLARTLQELYKNLTITLQKYWNAQVLP